jgi:hypothetical protein
VHVDEAPGERAASCPATSRCLSSRATSQIDRELRRTIDRLLDRGQDDESPLRPGFEALRWRSAIWRELREATVDHVVQRR